MGNGSDDSPFYLFMSGGFMLQALVDARMQGDEEIIFHLDSTHKTNVLGYKLLCIGISDKARKFFPLGYALTSHETEKVFYH